jgi:hypothetical protein
MGADAGYGDIKDYGFFTSLFLTIKYYMII